MLKPSAVVALRRFASANHGYRIVQTLASIGFAPFLTVSTQAGFLDTVKNTVKYRRLLWYITGCLWTQKNPLSLDS